MIPILQALIKVERDLPGGTSRPWIVSALNNNRLEDYVIKIYKDKDTASVSLFNKEIYATVLAQEFEIPVPEPSIIKLSPEFIKSLKGEDKIRIEELRSKVVFGNKYYEGYSDFPLSVSVGSIQSINPETVFAFDVFIRNFDRRKIKPNLITNGESFFCIDHEHSLHVNKLFSQYDIYQDWSSFRSVERCHLFYEYLSKRKDVDFFEFKEYLRTFSVRRLEEVVQYLLANQIEMMDFEETKAYIEDVLINKETFYNLLKISIS